MFYIINSMLELLKKNLRLFFFYNRNYSYWELVPLGTGTESQAPVLIPVSVQILTVPNPYVDQLWLFNSTTKLLDLHVAGIYSALPR